MIISEKKNKSLQKQKEIESEWLHEQNEQIRRCIEEGIPCSYGICDECPALNGNYDFGHKEDIHDD